MKKSILILLMSFVPSLLMAQAAGGTIKRTTGKKTVTEGTIVNKKDEKTNSSGVKNIKITTPSLTQSQIKQKQVDKELKHEKEKNASYSSQVRQSSKTEVINVSCQPIITKTHKWELSIIILSVGKTILRKYVTPQNAKSWICSSRKEYIEDVETGRKYYIQSSDIGFERKNIEKSEAIYFNETYPALPQSVTKVNISTGTDYFVRNLKIR